MTRVTGREYTYYSSKLSNNEPTKAVLTGDFQWLPQKMSKRNAYNISAVGKFIHEVEPNMIILPGDLVESVMYLHSKCEQEEFVDMMKFVTDGRATFWLKGNHDSGMVLKNKKWISSNDDVDMVRDVLSKVPNMHYVGGEGNSISLLDDAIVGKDFKPANIHISGVELPVQYYIEQKEELEEYLIHLESTIRKNADEFFKDDMLNICLIHDIRKLIIAIKQNRLPKDLLTIIKKIWLLIGGHNHGLGIPNDIAELFDGNWGPFSPSGELLPTDGRGYQKVEGIDTIQVSHVNFTPSNKKLDVIWGHNPWADVVTFKAGDDQGLILEQKGHKRKLVR